MVFALGFVGCKKKESPAAPATETTMKNMQMQAEDTNKAATATAEDTNKTATTAAASVEQTTCPVMDGNKINKNVFVEYKGIKDQPELIAYAISKAAVDKFVTDTVIRLKDTGVLMNLLDPGWLRTDLGGPQAPNAVESVLPGALVPALIDDGTTGQLFHAQDYAGKTI